jgi:DNA-binding HxlR family transcriptional regulator
VPRYDRVVNDSPLARALERVGDRWSFLVVDALLGGPRRFNELVEDVDGIAPSTLTQRLRHLEHEAILIATPYTDRPRRFEYALTETGHELAGALRMLADWGGRGEDAEPLTHATCGTPLEARWYCPTCAEAVEEVDAALRFV